MELDSNDSVEEIYDEIKQSMKKLISETNEVLKHSHSAFKKTKEKMVNLERLELKPNKLIKEWFEGHGQCTVPDFFELLFKNPENTLDYDNKTIELCEKDAKALELELKTPIKIYNIFERLPYYFQ